MPAMSLPNKKKGGRIVFDAFAVIVLSVSFGKSADEAERVRDVRFVVQWTVRRTIRALSFHQHSHWDPVSHWLVAMLHHRLLSLSLLFPPFFIHGVSWLHSRWLLYQSRVCVFGSEAIRPSFFLSCYYTVFLVRAISSCVVVLLLDFATLFLWYDYARQFLIYFSYRHIYSPQCLFVVVAGLFPWAAISFSAALQTRIHSFLIRIRPLGSLFVGPDSSPSPPVSVFTWPAGCGLIFLIIVRDTILGPQGEKPTDSSR